MSSKQQTQQADDPSGPGWRDVEVGEILQPYDMFRDGHNVWAYTENTGVTVREGWERKYRRRIEQQTQQADDPSGPDNQLANRIRAAMLASGLTRYQLSQQTGVAQAVLSRFASGKRDLTLATASRLVPALGLDLMATDTSDSEPETMEDHGRRLAVAVRQNVELADELEDVRRSKAAHQRIAKASVSRAQEAEALLAEAERSGKQVNAELQQLRERVQTLTQERDRYRNQLSGAIEHSSAAAAQQQVLERLQAWLRPVLELVAENPEDARSLAVAVLGYLPGIASRLIEE